MPGSLQHDLTVLGLVAVLLLAGCAGLIDDGGDATPEATSAAEAVVPDEEDTPAVRDAEAETMESFVETLEREDVDVLDYGFASDGFVGLVYRHDESDVESAFVAVAESYSRIASADPWSPDELRVMSIDADGDPVTTYRIETAVARAYDNGSITRDEYWNHIGASYDVRETDTPTPTPTPADDGGFSYPDDEDEEGEDTPTSTPRPAETPEPTPTPTPDDDDGVPGLP